MQRVEALLRDRMQSAIGTIPDVGAHLLLAGGKRLRPLIAALAARATGTDPTLALAVGCAAELIHTATLYHDDVVDDGRVRRGPPGRAPGVRQRHRRAGGRLLPGPRAGDRGRRPARCRWCSRWPPP